MNKNGYKKKKIKADQLYNNTYFLKIDSNALLIYWLELLSNELTDHNLNLFRIIYNSTNPKS